MKLTEALKTNGYGSADQQRIVAVYDSLAKEPGIDKDLLEKVAVKIAIWRLETEAVIGAMLSLGPIEVKSEAVASHMAADIRRLWEWSQRLPAQPKHPTTITNLMSLLITEAGDSPALLVMLIVAGCRLRLAQDGEAKDLARRALQLWAPLASRLALAQLKDGMEDTAFKILYPDKSQHISQLIERTYKTKPKFLKNLKSELRSIVRQAGIKVDDVQGRIKHVYSVYRKMARTGDIENIYDLVALRLIVPTIDSCYKAVIAIHDYWPELAEEKPTRDYIAKPKANGYQSIHTAVNADGEKIEIQIRTPAMHEASEEGVAAHWRYDQLKDSQDYQKGELVAVHRQTKRGQIYIFSPKGDVFHLPSGATALDFAYEVHTNLGLQARAVKINGKIAKLNSRLASGDVVEVITQKKVEPHEDWLRFVKTAKARNRIRHELHGQKS